MGKNKNKKRNKKRMRRNFFGVKVKEEKEKDGEESTWDFTCEHPLHVKVARHEVAIISWHDFDYDVHRHTVANLDAFIALTDIGFSKYEKFKQSYSNSLLQMMAEKFKRYLPTLENLIVLEITDGHIDSEVFGIARDLLEEGKKIGFGCMAGHGRTGWLLAKLIKHFENTTGDEAVRRARKRLCKKCVETGVQVTNLGCKNEIGWYEQKKIFMGKEDGNSFWAGEPYYEKWLREHKKEDTIVIKDTEEVEIQEIPETPEIPKVAEDAEGQPRLTEGKDTSRELIEAWRKINRDEALSEEEERLIMEDTARYG